jgi:hypothetical protein
MEFLVIVTLALWLLNLRYKQLSLFLSRNEVLTTVLLKIRVFWDATLCRLVNG